MKISYIKLVMFSHQSIMQQMPVHLDILVDAETVSFLHTHLRFNQHQVNEKYHKVMFHVFIAEAATVLAYCESYSMTTGAIIGARVFGVEGLDRVAAFYADWHCMDLSISSGHCAG